MITDASTATVHHRCRRDQQEGRRSTPSAWRARPLPTLPARAAFKQFADRLADFDQGGTIATEVYEPAAYRGSLLESPGMNAPDLRDWPWDELTVADFEANADPNGLSFPHRTMTADEVAELGIAPHEGGLVGLPLRGTDDKLYTLSLRPLLPDDEAAA